VPPVAAAAAAAAAAAETGGGRGKRALLLLGLREAGASLTGVQGVTLGRLGHRLLCSVRQDVANQAQCSDPGRICRAMHARPCMHVWPPAAASTAALLSRGTCPKPSGLHAWPASMLHLDCSDTKQVVLHRGASQKRRRVRFCTGGILPAMWQCRLWGASAETFKHSKRTSRWL